MALPAPIIRRTAAGQSLSLVQELRDVRDHAHLLFELVHRDLTVRYKRSFLGFFWTMLHPLLLMVIFTVVFSGLFRRETPHYETYFLSAYLAWNLFAQTTTNAMTTMAWNGPLMKRIHVPRSIFPLSSVVSGLVNTALSLLVLLAIMLVTHASIRPAIVVVPVSLLIVGVFTFGVSLVLMALSVFFADVREMYQAGLPALLYLSPVIYPVTIVPERYRWLVESNPLTYIIQTVRDPIYLGRIPSARVFAIALVTALLSLTLGWIIFRRLAPRFDARF